MARRDTYAFAQAGARALGWLNGVMGVVVLAYVVSRWPDEGSTAAAGLTGSAIALLNDSWESLSLLFSLTGRRPAPLRAMLWDMLSLAICLTGIVLLIFSDLTGFNQAHEPQDDGLYGQARVTRAAIAILAALVVWRFVFTFWACWDYSKLYQRTARRLREAEMQHA